MGATSRRGPRPIGGATITPAARAPGGNFEQGRFPSELAWTALCKWGPRDLPSARKKIAGKNRGDHSHIYNHGEISEPPGGTPARYILAVGIVAGERGQQLLWRWDSVGSFHRKTRFGPSRPRGGKKKNSAAIKGEEITVQKVSCRGTRHWLAEIGPDVFSAFIFPGRTNGPRKFAAPSALAARTVFIVGIFWGQTKN